MESLRLMCFLGWTVGGGELLVIFLVLLILFGNRLPTVAKSMGKAISEFKKGLYGIEKEIPKDIEPEKDKDKYDF